MNSVLKTINCLKLIHKSSMKVMCYAIMVKSFIIQTMQIYNAMDGSLKVESGKINYLVRLFLGGYFLLSKGSFLIILSIKSLIL